MSTVGTTGAGILERLRLEVAEETEPAAAAERRERSWDRLLEDWRSVFEDVYEFMSSLDPAEGDGRTMCDQWTQKDLVAHHIMGDQLTLQAFSGEDGFDFRTLDDGPQRSRADRFIDRFRPVPYAELVQQWKEGWEKLFQLSSGIEGDARYERVPWAAVPVSRVALLQARVSETWIHGWDSRWPRRATTLLDDRCYWITDLAVRTTIPYGLTKAGSDLLGTVSLALSGPAGGQWERQVEHASDPPHRIDGPAWVWLVLATRRWTDHLGWREDEAPDREDVLALMQTGGQAEQILDAARAFV